MPFLICGRPHEAGRAGRRGGLCRPASALLHAVCTSLVVLIGTASAGTVWARQAAPPLARPAAPRYDVVALRVEFQPDTTRFTTGTGLFDEALYDTLRPRIDPYPHDAGYFRAHLRFLEDYVARVSDGRTTVTTHLIPEVVRVSRPMAAYSPTGFEADSDAEQAKLAALVEEAWRLADAQTTFDAGGLDPARTAFVLFHAGVGRDVELVGTILDKTPQDLPSLFFGTQVLDRLLDAPAITYKGLPVDHTIVLPRTETRRGFNFITDEPVLAEFSINGLMAASFFNFLGVPDLFNTATGESAIGPFGLMDPLGLFAYSGLFPPEPMAWTKLYLGWTTPTELRDATPRDIALRAAGLLDASESARAWISGAEYFLVENRNRDPEGDGLVLRVWRDGAVVEQRVQNGDEAFNARNVSGFVGGVVVGVDNYDWALPGGLDERGAPLNGGILIWHVDERRLLQTLATNRVNADPDRRGIDLEEADGAQDLGFPSEGLFGPAGDTGTPFDFFYAGNPYVVETLGGREIRLYQNRFGPDTYPSSAANAGGPSFIVLDEFSAPGPVMTFTYRKTPEAGIVPLFTAGLPAPFGPDGALLPVAEDLLLAYAGAGAGENLFLLHGGQDTVAAAGRHVLAAPVLVQPVAEGAAYAAFVEAEGDLPQMRFVPKATLATGALESGTDVTVALPAARGLRPYLPLVTAGDGGSVYAAFGTPAAPLLLRVSLGGEVEAVPVAGALRSMALLAPGRIALVGDDAVRVAGAAAPGWTFPDVGGAAVGQVAFGREASGTVGVLPLVSEAALLVLLPDRVERIDVARRLGPARAGGLGAYPVPVDLDGDARLDVLTTYDSLLVAFTQGGAFVDGFPIRMGTAATAQPLVFQDPGDAATTMILVAGADGYVHAFTPSGRRREPPGFPLPVGRGIAATPAVLDGRLFAVAEDGSAAGWTLEGAAAAWWAQWLGDAGHRSYASGALPAPTRPPGSGLLVAEETYNWPNPIRDGRTFLRCATTRPSRVRITITDLAGGFVDEVEVGAVPGGVPTEHLWHTSAPSGIYLARVTATAEDGTSETHLIKMAVIR